MTMAVRLTRKLAIAAAAASMLALGACAAPGFRADVARFQSQLPFPQGQSFRIVAANPALSGGIEFGQYASLVAGELTRLGYRPAAPGEASDLTVAMAYDIDRGEQRIRSSPAFYDPWFGAGYGWGRGYYRPIIARGPHGRRFLYGWHDPFLFGGFGPERIETYTVFTSGFDLKIDRSDNGLRLFEGRAEARSVDNNLTQIVPNLVTAMFTGFPGNSGEKVRITVAPPPR
jgi:Domain of unknown function (DUF4136)